MVEVYAEMINYDISRIYEVPLTWREQVRTLIEHRLLHDIISRGGDSDGLNI